MSRREFIGLATGIVAGWPLAGTAQQARKIPMIGFLTPGFSYATGPGTSIAGLTDGVGDRGSPSLWQDFPRNSLGSRSMS
jgi:hypothetical protein